MRGKNNGPDYNGIRCTMARWSFVGMKTKEVIKILEENKLTNVEKKKEEEHWWERHKRYIEHRKEFPYYPEKNKSQK